MNNQWRSFIFRFFPSVQLPEGQEKGQKPPHSRPAGERDTTTGSCVCKIGRREDGRGAKTGEGTIRIDPTAGCSKAGSVIPLGIAFAIPSTPGLGRATSAWLARPVRPIWRARDPRGGGRRARARPASYDAIYSGSFPGGTRKKRTGGRKAGEGLHPSPLWRARSTAITSIATKRNKPLRAMSPLKARRGTWAKIDLRAGNARTATATPAHGCMNREAAIGAAIKTAISAAHSRSPSPRGGLMSRQCLREDASPMRDYCTRRRGPLQRRTARGCSGAGCRAGRSRRGPSRPGSGTAERPWPDRARTGRPRD